MTENSGIIYCNNPNNDDYKNDFNNIDGKKVNYNKPQATSIIYAKSDNNIYRYVLSNLELNVVKGEKKNNDKDKTLLIIGMNPSKANLITSDDTVNKVIEYAHNNDYTYWIMCNLFPLMMTNLPEEAEKLNTLIKNNKNFIEKNINCIEQQLTNVDTVLLCWGNRIATNKNFKEYYKEILRLISNSKKSLIVLKTTVLTNDGMPRHPQPRNVSIDTSEYKITVNIKDNIIEI